MSGINTGILHNAHPLTAAQIRELEERALTTGETFVYLDSSGKITFTGKVNPEFIKDLAWHNVHELSTGPNAITKNVYVKQAQKTFNLVDTLQKASTSDSWVSATSVLDTGLLDEFILD